MFFDIGGTELLVIVIVTILVVGPKDLPKLLRAVGQFVGKARRMAGEFQTQFNAALREAEREADLEDASKSIADLKSLNPVTNIKDEIKKSIEDAGNPAAAKPAPKAIESASDEPGPASAEPAPMPLVEAPDAEPQPEEPIKTGAAGKQTPSGEGP
ncbi:Sec-independent protein translocase protein TatB [Hartmannibacter diazotrophicus]|uniref:Sec-independent protein translocase protein TatB n=1 Tax=Hartmannibacter diazotrophicus TaxID=1482074 RepID=A0A2C9D6K2_9HYPH|nr:Sec-independent protein translocase protein TatB [Hartmannibacter diazotrophicus]SON55954.1 Sec-independent protein translocase protein TatB [Hartmannibacter diazotrophicus]